MAEQSLLRSLREAKGLTLREVARRSGINPGRLSIIERGVQPKPEETAAILAALEKVA
jgi:transcriptional regulator with XRE-family HTH domain